MTIIMDAHNISHITHYIPRETHMKLYEATNGYIGESYVRCLVIAPDDETAMNMARSRFKEHWQAATEKGFSKNIELEALCDDTSMQWSSEASDG